MILTLFCRFLKPIFVGSHRVGSSQITLEIASIPGSTDPMILADTASTAQMVPALRVLARNARAQTAFHQRLSPNPNQPSGYSSLPNNFLTVEDKSVVQYFVND